MIWIFYQGRLGPAQNIKNPTSTLTWVWTYTNFDLTQKFDALEVNVKYLGVVTFRPHLFDQNPTLLTTLILYLKISLSTLFNTHETLIGVLNRV